MGAFIESQGKSDAPFEENSTEVERNQALDACLAASELFEFGITLNNSVYRCRSLCSLKLLHAMRCEELGCGNQSREYIVELKEFVKSHSVKNPSLLNQLEQFEHRFQSVENDKELVSWGGLTNREKGKEGGILTQLFSALDKGINTLMTAVDSRETSPVEEFSPSAPPMSPNLPPVLPPTPSLPLSPSPAAPLTPPPSSALSQPAMRSTPARSQPGIRRSRHNVHLVSYVPPTPTPTPVPPAMSQGTVEPPAQQGMESALTPFEQPIQAPAPIPFEQPAPVPFEQPQPAPAPIPFEQPASIPAAAPFEQSKPASAPFEPPQTAPALIPFEQPQTTPAPAPIPFDQPASIPAPTPIPFEQPKPTPTPIPAPAPFEQPQPKPAPAPFEQPKPAPAPFEQPKPAPAPAPAPSKPAKESTPAKEPKKEEHSSWFSFSFFRGSDSGKKVYKVDLSKDEVKPYYDEAKKRWIIPGEPEEEEAPAPPPPPPMTPVQPELPAQPAQPAMQPPQPPMPAQQPENPAAETATATATATEAEAEVAPPAAPPIKAFMPFMPEQKAESTTPSSTPPATGGFLVLVYVTCRKTESQSGKGETEGKTTPNVH